MVEQVFEAFEGLEERAAAWTAALRAVALRCSMALGVSGCWTS